MGEGIERTFRALPGYDCFEGCVHGSPDCRPGSSGFHGMGSLRLYFAVAVPGEGAVSFDLFTPMYPASVHRRGGEPRLDFHPLGTVDLHYGKMPDHLRDWSTSRDCNLLGGKCWGDFTSLAADVGYDALLSGGEQAVWSWLAETYLPDVLRPA